MWVSALWKTALLAVVPLMALGACTGDSGPTESAADSPVVRVVATTNIVADWVENIGGEHVDVFSLVPIGADPHSYQPGAKDVARIAEADLVLSVGLGLEESWLRELVVSAARDPSAIVELAEMVDPIEFGESHAQEVETLKELSHIVHEVEEGEISPEEALEEIKALFDNPEGEDGGEDHGGEEDADEGEDHGDEAEEEGEHHGEEDELGVMALAIVNEVEEGRREAGDAMEAIEALTSEGEEEHEGHGHGTHDPHFWFDPIRVKTAVNEIASRLAALDPDRGDSYRSNASAYSGQLEELHAWTEERVSVVPENRRLLIASHDSLGYFATRYGFDVIGVILSITTEVDPSPGDLAGLIEEAIENEVPAVFGETTVSERLANAVATESGAELVRLYSGSLGSDDTGARTYIGMVRTNVDRIVEALR